MEVRKGLGWPPKFEGTFPAPAWRVRIRVIGPKPFTNALSMAKVVIRAWFGPVCISKSGYQILGKRGYACRTKPFRNTLTRNLFPVLHELQGNDLRRSFQRWVFAMLKRDDIFRIAYGVSYAIARSSEFALAFFRGIKEDLREPNDISASLSRQEEMPRERTDQCRKCRRN